MQTTYIYNSFRATLPAHRPLAQGSPLRIDVMFLPSGLGSYEDRIELVFQNEEFLYEDESLQQRFVITRGLRAVVGVKEVHEALAPVAPYVARKAPDGPWENPRIDGEKPPALAAIQWTVALPKAPVPQEIEDVYRLPTQAERIRHVARSILPRALNSRSYARHWKALIHIEEEQMRWGSPFPLLDF